MAIATVAGTGTTTAKLNDLNALIGEINRELAAFEARAKNLEEEPDVPDVSDRVAALEILVATLRAPEPVPITTSDIMSAVPVHPPRDVSEGIELVYDKATLYLGDLELHALRVGEDTWRLLSQLNYITVSQIIWTYDETVTGTPDEVYAHAYQRLTELAEIKVQHDAAHDRVRRMSEGEP